MLTARQKELVEYIATETARTGGIAPTRREMAVALGAKSAGDITRLVRACVARGALRAHPSRARAIEVIPRPKSRMAWFVFDDTDKVLKPRISHG